MLRISLDIEEQIFLEASENSEKKEAKISRILNVIP